MIDPSIKCITWNGRLVVIGFAGGDIEKLALNRVLLKNISIVGLHWGRYAVMESNVVLSTWKGIFDMINKGQIRGITFTDKNSRFMSVYLMHNRGEMLEMFKQYYNCFLTQTGQKIQILKTDNALEYQSNDYLHFYNEKGILHELTSPYTPEENGISERINRTLIEMTKCMLKTAKMEE